MYNLSTNSGLAKINADYQDDESRISLYEKNMLEDLLKTGKTNIAYGNNYVFYHDDTWFTSKNGVNCKVFFGLWKLLNKKHHPISHTPSYVLLPGDKKQKLFIVINADDDAYHIDVDPAYKQLSISFNCLSQFYVRKTSKSAIADRNLERKHVYTCAEKLANGIVKIVDYEVDKRIELTATQKRAIIKKMTLHQAKKYLKNAPEVGYTYIYNYNDGGYWHKSSTTLMYDTEANISFIFGQDEGTYFACQLVDNPKTVQEAYLSLQPKEVRGTDSKRQGEWFFLKTEKPDISECSLEIADEFAVSVNISLNRESLDSAKHSITSEHIVVKGNSVYALNPILKHENGDHVDVSETGWVKFCRNTAVFSVSAEGVD